MYTKCKYFNKHFDTIQLYIQCLYSIEGCGCGGICHIVTDDNNFEDHHIQFVLNECTTNTKNIGEELEISKLICNDLLKLSIQERALLFVLLDNDYVYCNNICETCPIEHGKMNTD